MIIQRCTRCVKAGQNVKVNNVVAALSVLNFNSRLRCCRVQSQAFYF